MQVRISCECGNEIVADSAQAGLSVACPCGRSVEVPAWRRSAQARVPGRVQETSGTGLLPIGWAFLLVAALVVLVVGFAAGETAAAIGLPAGRFRVLIVGGALLVLALIGAVLRVVFGVNFYRE
jgi:hypothetical protein